jgi:hypothetical protein
MVFWLLLRPKYWFRAQSLCKCCHGVLVNMELKMIQKTDDNWSVYRSWNCISSPWEELRVNSQSCIRVWHIHPQGHIVSSQLLTPKEKTLCSFKVHGSVHPITQRHVCSFEVHGTTPDHTASHVLLWSSWDCTWSHSVTRAPLKYMGLCTWWHSVMCAPLKYMGLYSITQRHVCSFEVHGTVHPIAQRHMCSFEVHGLCTWSHSITCAPLTVGLCTWSHSVICQWSWIFGDATSRKPYLASTVFFPPVPNEILQFCYIKRDLALSCCCVLLIRRSKQLIMYCLLWMMYNLVCCCSNWTHVICSFSQFVIVVLLLDSVLKAKPKPSIHCHSQGLLGYLYWYGCLGHNSEVETWEQLYQCNFGFH